MRQRKTILRKIDSIKDNAIMSPAVYRLFTFVPWEDIPDEHKTFFPKEAEEKWDEDLKEFKEAHLLLDLDTEIKAVLKALNKRLIIQALALMPIVLADFFVLGNPMDPYEIKLKEITDNFVSILEFIPQEDSEMMTMLELTDLLKKITKKLDVDITNNIDKVLEDMLTFYVEDNAKRKEYSKVAEVMSNGKTDEQKTNI